MLTFRIIYINIFSYYLLPFIMQLTLNFPEIDIKEVPTDNHCEDSYMQEFEQ